MDNNTSTTRIFSFSSLGYEGSIVSVETDLRRGIPAVDIVGLADSQVRESRERIRAAFKNSNLEFPQERVLQSLSPVDLRKEGAGFDLPMALSILNAQHNYELGADVLAMGELELSGHVRSINGVRAAVETAMTSGIYKFIVPEANMKEALSVPGAQVLGVSSLSEVHEKLNSKENGLFKMAEIESASKKVEFDEEALNMEQSYFTGKKIADIQLDGYYDAARAIEIAIAGKHNILLEGQPGCGKTMLAEALFPALTPQLTSEESQSTTRIWSLAGLTKPTDPMIKSVPFRMPHQTASIEGMCGGGSNCHPGEISLAHNGILFLDEAAEFRSSVLQMMRVPLETNSITLSRAGRATTYPSDFQLVMAAAPCPCGNYGSHDKICLCSAKSIDEYWKKFSAPLLDRVEIKQHVEKDENDTRNITVAEMKKHIENAFKIQRENPNYNSSLTPQEIAEKCVLDEESNSYFESKIQKYGFSPRSKANTLKVALTIANMDNRLEISLEDLKEAVELNAPLFEKSHEYKHLPKNEPEETKTVENEKIEMTETVIDLANGKTYTQPYTNPVEKKDVPVSTVENTEEVSQKELLSEEATILEKNNLPDFKKTFEEDVNDRSNSDAVVISNATNYIGTLQNKLVETFKQNEKLVQEKEDLKKEIDSLRQRNHKKSSGMGY